MGFELTDEAVEDLNSIFDYTEREFGFDQAVLYLNELEECFTFLGANSKSGRERTDIRLGLRSFAKDNHLVFYRIVNDTVRVIRILHGSKDLPTQF